MNTDLVIKDLRVNVGDKEILKGLNLTVKPGTERSAAADRLIAVRTSRSDRPVSSQTAVGGPAPRAGT